MIFLHHDINKRMKYCFIVFAVFFYFLHFFFTHVLFSIHKLFLHPLMQARGGIVQVKPLQTVFNSPTLQEALVVQESATTGEGISVLT
jgi:hypothetical protein